MASTTPAAALNSNNPTTPTATTNDALTNPSTPSTTTSGSHSGTTSAGIRLTERTINETSWPPDLVLDLGKSNWMEWSRKLNNMALRQGFAPWLNGSLPCPDPDLTPDANYIWHHNDGGLRGFIQDHVSPADVHLIDALPTAHKMFEALQAHHEQQGAFAQINLLLKALQIQVSYDKSIRDSVADMRNFYRRITAMGKFTDDDIFTVILMNSMNTHFGPLQQTINSMSSTPGFNSETIAARLVDEDNLIRRRVELGQSPNPYMPASPSYPPSSLSPASAFATLTSRPRFPRLNCDNCKCEGHTSDYCVHPGGKMAGRSIEEARAAYRASLNKHQTPDTQVTPPPSSTTPVPMMNPSSLPSSSNTIFVNGLPYTLDPTCQTPKPSSAHIAEYGTSPDLTAYSLHTGLNLAEDATAYVPHVTPSSAHFSQFGTPGMPDLNSYSFYPGAATTGDNLAHVPNVLREEE